MLSTTRNGRSGETRRGCGSRRDQGPNTGATEQNRAELDETGSRTRETHSAGGEVIPMCRTVSRPYHSAIPYRFPFPPACSFSLLFSFLFPFPSLMLCILVPDYPIDSIGYICIGFGSSHCRGRDVFSGTG